MFQSRNSAAEKRAKRRGLLTPGQYDAVQADFLASASIPILMAFRPATYQTVGFPTDIKTCEELIRYVDHNFEAETPRLYEPNAVFEPVGYQNAFSNDEKDLIESVRRKVGDLTDTVYGRRTLPITNILVQSGPLRIMEQMRAHMGAEAADTKVFEVGPGAGYLGAMLLELGYSYHAYDVTQALYLWQSHLLKSCARDGFKEYADRPYREIGTTRSGHFAWWQFTQMLQSPPLAADIVYSNSNLGEMSPLALDHVLHISKSMLQDSPLGVFCFFSTGMVAQNSAEAIDARLKTFGFSPVFDSPFNAYVLDESHIPALKSEFSEGIRHFNPSKGETTLNAADVVSTDPAEWPIDCQISQWLHGWVPPQPD